VHSWGEEKFDWVGLDDAGQYISQWLVKWTRMPVYDVKEKFGTLRIYCSFGWESFYGIYRPRHMWVPKWWPYRLDLRLSHYIMPLLNKIVVPLQQKAYAWRYKKAVEKWPHLREEIVSIADRGELFEGVIPGYKHSDYWRTYV
jgi:hypothetical protein